jgi:ankyrin repeat protein
MNDEREGISMCRISVLICLTIMLLACPAWADASDDLYGAIGNGDLQKAQAVLKQSPAAANTRMKDGDYPLHFAIAFKETQIVRLLISYGANVNVKGQDGESPLGLSFGGGPDIYEIQVMLLKAGADPRARDKDGMTPLHRAALMAQEKTVELLLGTYHVDVNARDNKGTTPLGYTTDRCLADYERTRQILLQYGAKM